MDDTIHGARDRRGYWKPYLWSKRLPVFVWPVQPMAFLRWLFGFPGYLWPWNTFYLVLAFVVWWYLTPSLETMRELDAVWISLIFLRNAAVAVVVYGGLHTLFYIRRYQQTNFKYNIKWPDTGTFLFGSQTAENVFWVMCSGVPIWSAYEALTWWMLANGYVPYVNFQDHPVYFVVLLALIPLWRELQFYLVHRFLHIGPLYHFIHKVHHNSVNPAPWSGLSMHPVEHLLHFSTVLIHFIIPSHPLHILLHLLIAGAFGPARGHLGFDRIVVGDERFINNDHYMHYLHHKYFEVNYGDALIPFDEWFGTAHDGSAEADEVMHKRLKAKKSVRSGSNK